MSANARIGVTAYDGVVTSGLSGNGSVESFFSDSDREMIGLNADGEAVIGKPVTVAFAPGDENAAGTMESGSPRSEMRFDASYGAGEISPHENTVSRSTRFDPNRKHHPPPSR